MVTLITSSPIDHTQMPASRGASKHVPVPRINQTIDGLGVRSALVAYAVWFVVGGPSGGTLAHEIGHALLHEQFDNRALAELDAESTVYVI
jgi:hypothetical protein